jgi:hypothetical protein
MRQLVPTITPPAEPPPAGSATAPLHLPPLPPSWNKYPPLPSLFHVHPALASRMSGWQTTLIAMGVAILAALAVILYRARARARAAGAPGHMPGGTQPSAGDPALADLETRQGHPSRTYRRNRSSFLGVTDHTARSDDPGVIGHAHAPSRRCHG